MIVKRKAIGRQRIYLVVALTECFNPGGQPGFARATIS